MHCPTCNRAYARAKDEDDRYVRELCRCEDGKTCGHKACQRAAAVARLNHDLTVDKYLCAVHGNLELLDDAGPTPMGPPDGDHLASTEAQVVDVPREVPRLHTDEELRADAKANDFKCRCRECGHIHHNSQRNYTRTATSVSIGCPKCKCTGWFLVEA